MVGARALLIAESPAIGPTGATSRFSSSCRTVDARRNRSIITICAKQVATLLMGINLNTTLTIDIFTSYCRRKAHATYRAKTTFCFQRAGI